MALADAKCPVLSQSRCLFCLPKVRGNYMEAAKELKLQMDPKTCRLLVVDDDEAFLKIVAAALGREGYEVTTTPSGLEALQLAMKNPVDVVLLDINLPDISGVEVMRQITKTTSVPVILVTGDAAHYSHEFAIQEGAADFIVKPVRLPELVLRIKHALEVQSQTAAQERLIVELEHMAIRDELTGLYNYRQFKRLLKEEVQRSLRYKHPLSLIVLDADHFKAINDTLGHANGDRVLAGIARVLLGKIRETDTGFRHGGEEFAVVLPETCADKGLAVAERVRQAIEEAELVKGRSVTVSAGIAEFLPTEDADALIRRTDTALYAAKRAGRNRVVMA